MPDPSYDDLRVDIGDAQMKPSVQIGDAQITKHGFSFDDLLSMLGIMPGHDGGLQLVQNEHIPMPDKERYGDYQPPGTVGEAQMRGQAQPNYDVLIGPARMK